MRTTAYKTRATALKKCTPQQRKNRSLLLELLKFIKAEESRLSQKLFAMPQYQRPYLILVDKPLLIGNIATPNTIIGFLVYRNLQYVLVQPLL